MAIKLRKKENKDGTTSLRMDIHHNGKRWVETLQQLKLRTKPSNERDRADNKDKMEQAKAIVLARSVQLESQANGAENKLTSKIVVLDWMRNYVAEYQKKDINTMKGVLSDFTNFLREEKKLQLTFGGVDAPLVEDFILYLQEHHEGEGAPSYFNRFKKMIRHAYRRRIIRENVIDFVELKPSGQAKKRDILTLEELRLLSQTTIQSNVVKRAALFTVSTGIRFGDLKALTWANVDLSKKILKLEQGKTKNDVEITLNDVALNQLGEPGKPADLVFKLPSHDGCNKTLKKWVLRAGIKKHITWHNLRHSFGTNLIFTGTDVVTTSRLMGHRSLRYTNRYIDTSEQLKKSATDNLNF